MAVKEKALRRLADKLNAAQVPWAIGAGWLFCRKGILNTWHDFDLFTDAEHAAEADRVLSKLGMRSDAKETPDGFRCSYHFDGAEIDLNAGMPITRGDSVWKLCFDETSVAEDTDVLGASVHLMHVEDWAVLYALMGRKEKSDAAFAYLKQNGFSAERFEHAVQGELPDEVKQKIKELMEEQV